MSVFVNSATLPRMASDNSIREPQIGDDDTQIRTPQVWDLFIGAASFANQWWPANDADYGATIGVMGASRWAEYYPVSGANGRLAIVGYTRDAYGSPMGGATVKLFRTVDDSLQASIVSDANGLYSVSSPYADGHYLVVYKVGPPDFCGTTLNTLAPG